MYRGDRPADHDREIRKLAELHRDIRTGVGIWRMAWVNRTTPWKIWRVRRALIQKDIEDQKTLARCWLSTAEIRVLQGLADGLSNEEIAEHLGCGLGMVEQHLKRAAVELGAGNDLQCVVKAVAKGVIQVKQEVE